MCYQNTPVLALDAHLILHVRELPTYRDGLANYGVWVSLESAQ